jgi:hypothetical protein
MFSFSQYDASTANSDPWGRIPRSRYAWKVEQVKIGQKKRVTASLRPPFAFGSFSPELAHGEKKPKPAPHLSSGLFTASRHTAAAAMAGLLRRRPSIRDRSTPYRRRSSLAFYATPARRRLWLTGVYLRAGSGGPRGRRARQPTPTALGGRGHVSGQERPELVDWFASWY